MTTPPFPDWTSHASDAAFTDPTEMLLKADRFDQTIRRRNLREYAAGWFGVALSLAIAGFFAWAGEFAHVAALLLLTVGFLVVMRNLHRRGSRLQRLPEEPCIEHLRRQYRHQAEALRSVASWYIGPLVPGMLAMQAAIFWSAAKTQGWEAALTSKVLPIVMIVAFVLGVIALNRWAARDLMRKLEELDALAGTRSLP